MTRDSRLIGNAYLRSTDRETFEVIPCVNADGHRTSWDICYPSESDASGVGVVASCYGTLEQAHAMAAALSATDKERVLREALEQIAHGEDLTREDCRQIALRCPQVSKRGRYCA